MLPERFGLAIGECCIFNHAAAGHPPVWIMAWRFTRTTDGKPEVRHLPVNPNGDHVLGGAWGLRPLGGGRWQIAPSIRCLEQRGDAPGEEIETWHETPVIEGVPDDEPWTR